jgi:phosphoribosylformylglycinamidine synthase
VDFVLEKAVQMTCRIGIHQGWVQSAHDCAEGGLAVALAESSISGRLGATVTIPADSDRLDAVLFGEAASRIVVSVSPDHQSVWEGFLGEQLSQDWAFLGRVEPGEGSLQIAIADQGGVIHQPVKTLAQGWSMAIERRLQ